MDKPKRPRTGHPAFRILNWVFLIAIVVLTGHLVISQLSPTQSVTESIAGTWTGIITDDYDEFIVYDFTIDFSRNDDGSFSGTTFAQSQAEFSDVHAGTSIHAAMRDDTTLFYYDTSIHGANTGWCRINSTLTWTSHNGVETLAGKWQGIPSSGCTGTSGRIHLIKAS